MKKIIIILMTLILSIQSFSETVVKGIYEKNKKRYKELNLKVMENIKLNSISIDNKNSVTLKLENYDIIMDKNELLNLYNSNNTNKLSKLKNTLTNKEAVKYNLKNKIAELVENNKAIIYDKKNKTELKNIIKVEYHNYIYYDEGRGSGYEGYSFYADDNFEKVIMNFDIVVPGLGIPIHSSLGDNPYTENQKVGKNFEKYNERKELYEKARINPDKTITIKY